MNSVEVFDRALEADGAAIPAAVGALLVVAREVSAALREPRLAVADRERIYRRSLDLVARREAGRRPWHVLRRSRPVVIGGATALALGAAGLGWAALHGRRSRGPGTGAAVRLSPS